MTFCECVTINPLVSSLKKIEEHFILPVKGLNEMQSYTSGQEIQVC